MVVWLMLEAGHFGKGLTRTYRRGLDFRGPRHQIRSLGFRVFDYGVRRQEYVSTLQRQDWAAVFRASTSMKLVDSPLVASP